MLERYIDLDSHLDETGEARVKLASINEIEQYIAGFKPDPAFTYLHVIAMGAGEYYGCNKNGDYFPEKSLKLYHHTFEQNAKVFKEHANKPHNESFGTVAKSWYNPTMHRVELLLAVNKEKSPEVVAKMERGEHPEVSMGCRVPHDVCSICGNKAAKKNEYCEHITKNNKHVYPDGRQAYMLNLQPTFFDISFVFRRADKIAFTLRKVASGMCSLDHVFDIDDKVASIDKEVPGDAVVRILNTGMFNVLPKLEDSEPDLPPAMLDRMALRHSLEDILHTALHNYIPLKPREVTRIIVIQNGMPMNSYDSVLRGLLGAKRGAECSYNGGYQDELEELLAPHMESRSSLGPHVMHRVLRLGLSKQANEIRNPVPYRDAPYYDPTFNNELNGYRYNYSTVPVMYSPEEYQRRRQELAQRTIRRPMNPFAVGLMLGAMYAAYRGATGLKSVVDTTTSNKGALIAGAVALGVVGSMRKEAGLMDNKFVTHYVAPFVGAHLASAHYRNKFMRGEELNGVQQFIAENPDYLSVAAPFAMHFGSKKLGPSPTKVASTEKLADFADNLSQAALTGIIFRGRGMSGVGNVVDQAEDGIRMRHALKTTAPKEPVQNYNLSNQQNQV